MQPLWASAPDLLMRKYCVKTEAANTRPRLSHDGVGLISRKSVLFTVLSMSVSCVVKARLEVGTLMLRVGNWLPRVAQQVSGSSSVTSMSD